MPLALAYILANPLKVKIINVYYKGKNYCEENEGFGTHPTAPVATIPANPLTVYETHENKLLWKCKFKKHGKFMQRVENRTAHWFSIHAVTSELIQCIQI